MEEWNVEILEIRVKMNHLNRLKIPQAHHSITPLLHYSNWGEASKFYLAPLPKRTIFIVRKMIIRSIKTDMFLI